MYILITALPKHRPDEIPEDEIDDNVETVKFECCSSGVNISGVSIENEPIYFCEFDKEEAINIAKAILSFYKHSAPQPEDYLQLMKEVIKYLEKLRSNILSISKIRIQHSTLLDLIQKEGNILTSERIKQMRDLNDEVSDVIGDLARFNRLNNKKNRDEA